MLYSPHALELEMEIRPREIPQNFTPRGPPAALPVFPAAAAARIKVVPPSFKSHSHLCLSCDSFLCEILDSIPFHSFVLVYPIKAS